MINASMYGARLTCQEGGPGQDVHAPCCLLPLLRGALYCPLQVPKEAEAHERKRAEALGLPNPGRWVAPPMPHVYTRCSNMRCPGLPPMFLQLL